MILQIVMSLLVGVVIYEVFSSYKKKNLTLFSFLLWLFIWSAVLFIVWFANLTDYLSNFLHIKRGIDSVVYLSIVVLFYLLFRVLLKMEKIEQKLEKIVRAEALEK